MPDPNVALPVSVEPRGRGAFAVVDANGRRLPKSQISPTAEDAQRIADVVNGAWEKARQERRAHLQEGLLGKLGRGLVKFDERLHPRDRQGEFARKLGAPAPARPKLNPAGMTEGDLMAHWARLDRELLPYAGRPDHPEARAIIDEQKAVTKALHHRNVDRGGPEGIGKPGGPKDVLIVGAGPAGLSAAIYGATEGLDTMLVDANPTAGGQAGMSSRIENVLGFPSGITGRQLAKMGLEQAQRVGAHTSFGVQVESLEVDEKTGLKRVKLSNGKTVEARAVVIAGGVQFTKMSFPGSECKDVVYGDSTKLKERCRGREVVIVGGANSAGQAAIDAASEAKKVTVLIRHGSIRDKMSEYLVKQLEDDPKVEIRTGEVGLVEQDGEGRMKSVTLKDGTKLPAGALGMFIGSSPQTDWAGVDRDDHGYVTVKPGTLETSLPGVFAAGDVRAGSIHRVITAASDGAAAIAQTHGFLASLRESAVDEARRYPDDEADRWMDAVDRFDRRRPFTGG